MVQVSRKSKLMANSSVTSKYAIIFVCEQTTLTQWPRSPCGPESQHVHLACQILLANEKRLGSITSVMALMHGHIMVDVKGTRMCASS